MQSKEFVIQNFGVAPYVNVIKFDEQEIVQEMYLNKYASIICYYQDDSMIGFIVIGNTDKFKYTDYRSGTLLFETTIREAAGQSQGFLTGVEQMIGGRIDCNRYYVEYYTQHLYEDEQIVGYAICDIGFMDEEMNEKFNNAPTLYLIEENNKGISKEEILERKDMEDIRESKFNTYFTIAYNGVDAKAFIDRIIVNDCFLALNKGQYFNMFYQYEDYKELYEE